MEERKLFTRELADKYFTKRSSAEDGDDYEPYYYWTYKPADGNEVCLFFDEDDADSGWLLTIDGDGSVFHCGSLDDFNFKYVDELQQALDLFGVGIKVGEIFIY